MKNFHTQLLPACEETLTKAAESILREQIIAFPTETVYGLGALFKSEKAVREIFAVKGRPQDNPLIAHIYALEQVELIASEIPKVVEKLFTHFFPGPLTVVLPKKASVPPLISAGLNTIAFRMPNHPVALNLIEKVGAPIVAPSANLSGKPSPISASHVLEDLEGKIPLIIDGGKTTIGIESTVISLCNPKKPILLRPGIITKEQLEHLLSTEIFLPDNKTMASSPGMKYCHYAPYASVFLFFTKAALDVHIDKNNSVKRRVLSKPNAETLYAFLRESDKEKCEEVCILVDEATQKNAALMDRLLRASKNN